MIVPLANIKTLIVLLSLAFVFVQIDTIFLIAELSDLAGCLLSLPLSVALFTVSIVEL